MNLKDYELSKQEFIKISQFNKLKDLKAIEVIKIQHDYDMLQDFYKLENFNAYDILLIMQENKLLKKHIKRYC